MSTKRKFVMLTVCLGAVFLMIILIGHAYLNGIKEKEAKGVFYPMKSLSNICAYEGKVYCGQGSFYGEPIVQKSNIFAIQDGKVYYVEKVQEAYDSLTDELLPIWRSDFDGSNAEIIAEDDFLAGSGHERLIGDKLFYGFQYNEDHSMQYAYIDLETGERKEVHAANRIDNILGYDGYYLYYAGYDMKKEANILGRLNLQKEKDEILVSYAGEDEEGYIDTVQFKDGMFYCFTLKVKPDSFDYREYQYEMQIRSGRNGKIISTLPYSFTGSANYSFLLQEDELYLARADGIVSLPLAAENETEREEKLVVPLKEKEYWGILYFIPGDGYLYYETLAEIDETTGENDYFYRVLLSGNEPPELLAGWYTP